MHYQIVPATPLHVGPLVSRMTALGTEPIAAGRRSRSYLRQRIAESSEAWIALVDGAPAAVWGIIGAPLATDGYVWFAVADQARRYRLTIVRGAMAWLEHILTTRRVIHAHVRSDDSRARRFAEFLGFWITKEEVTRIDGFSFQEFTLEREAGRRPFIIYSLPRSRTYWLSRFLSYADHECWHEPSQRFRGIDDIRSWLSQDRTGTSDTSAASWWRLVQKYRPDIKTVVVRRPVAEVVESLMRLDMHGVCTFNRQDLTARMEKMDRKLDQIERRVPNALSVNFADLETESTCAKVFEHCLSYRHDHEWWASMTGVNLQCDMPALMRYQIAHGPQIKRLITLCKTESASIIRGRRRGTLNDVSIRKEPFEVFWRDGQELFAEHAAEVGGRDGVFHDLNAQMAESLDRNGVADIIVARLEEKMIGYLVFLLVPSLEDADLLVAHQNTFFVSQRFRGVGVRLLRAALDVLRDRGVGEVVFRAGVRGDGPRLDALYRRLGAKDYGNLYNLMLKRAA